MPSSAIATRRGVRRGVGGWWGADRVSTGNVFTPRVATARVGFDDPPRDLDVGPSSQEWRIKVRKGRDIKTDPYFTLDLYEAGQFVESVIPRSSVNSLDPIVLEGSWEANILEDSSGQYVEARLTSINYKGTTYVDVGALQWTPVLTNTVTKSLTLRWDTRKNVTSSPLTLLWHTL